MNTNHSEVLGRSSVLNLLDEFRLEHIEPLRRISEADMFGMEMRYVLSVPSAETAALCTLIPQESHLLDNAYGCSNRSKVSE